MNIRYYVYLLRCVDALVYVGKTKDRVYKRTRAHEKEGQIFDDVEIKGPYSLELAEALETGLIKDFSPIYNIQHNDDCRRTRLI